VELHNFTQQFIGEELEEDSQLSLFPYEFAFHGDPPELCRFGEHDELENFVIKDIKTSLETGYYKRSEIAIIYDDKTYGAKSFKYEYKEIPISIFEKLESAGIPAKWVSQDVRAKEMFDITTDRISLISIHSSKGLDFDLVYLLGIDHIHPTDDLRDKLQTLIYVAMTRAKYRLVIPYVEESEFITLMKTCLPIRGAIAPKETT
jgi:superfamily I DNA and RNA helicase